MKRLLLTLLVLTVLPISASYAEGLTGCAFGTVQTNDGFESINGGARFGFITPFDQGRDMYLRIVGGSVNLGESDISTIQAVMMMKWYIGKRWDVWWTIGGDSYIGGDNRGTDMITGLGVSRKVATLNKGWSQPTVLRGFFEMSFTDASGQSTGKYGQINIGVAFSPGKQ